jgi:hypothetical protein
MMGASLFPEAVTRKLLQYYHIGQQTDSSVLTRCFSSFGRTDVGTQLRYVLAVCLVSEQHCFVYHKMRNQMCFKSFSRTVTRTWPCPRVCRWRGDTTNNVNRISENGPTNKSPLSNRSHQCIWDLKICNAPISKRRNMDPKLQWWLDCVY